MERDLEFDSVCSVNLCCTTGTYVDFLGMIESSSASSILAAHLFILLYHRLFSSACGRTGYTGSTGRTGPSPDPSDPTAYCTHTSLAQLLASSSLLVEVYPSF